MPYRKTILRLAVCTLVLLATPLLGAEPQAAKPKDYPPPPWHLVDLWWDTGEDRAFESYSIDVDISDDLPSSVNLYIAPVGLGHLSKTPFYGGIQTQVDGYTKQDQKLRKLGPGFLFSMWGQRSFEAIRPSLGGFCQSSGHEGDFVSVRRPYQWYKGKFTYKLVRMDKEEADGQPATWVGAFVYPHEKHENIFVGALRFKGEKLVLARRLASFVEVYGRRIPLGEIPKVTVTFGNLMVNGKPAKVATADAIYPARVPDYAEAVAKDGTVVVKVGQPIEGRKERRVRLIGKPASTAAAPREAARGSQSEETRTRDEWLKDRLLGAGGQAAAGQEPPFSFLYGGQPSRTLLAAWPRKTEKSELSKARTQHTQTWTDAKTSLKVRCVAVQYADFPALEWTVYLKNSGRESTPLLANIQAIDAAIERADGGEFLLRYNKGDTCAPDLYQPLEQPLAPDAKLRLAPAGGRGTNHAFPYWNLTMPGRGLFLALGWPGQWAATFSRDAGRRLKIVAGQELTHLVLRPGEEIRTPLVAMMFWQGTDAQQAQNLWRRWMIAHNLPRTADGALPPPIVHGNTSLEFNEMCNANEENQKFFIDRYVAERIPIDFWWMDAGWYPCKGWPQTGTWEPDLKRFPHGLRAISDHARTKGIKTLVWFEPERVAEGTWLAENHPEWLLGRRLLDLGKPEARNWLTDHVDRVLREQGIDLYRQDFNMDPLDYWRRNDAPDRQGMTENLHVQGYLAYWDALRQRYPKLIIDSCASGGRRNDLETMRRAVPLHPTDYNYGHLAAKQAFHQSLFQWIPYFGSNTVPVDTVDAYGIRSGHALSVALGYDFRKKDLDYALLRKLVEEVRLVAPYYYADYYPLTPYSLAEDAWCAWQFNRPQEADGLVEAFRRPRNSEASHALKLHCLDPRATYEIKNLDEEGTTRVTGRELMEKGLPVSIARAPQAAVITYKRLQRD